MIRKQTEAKQTKKGKQVGERGLLDNKKKRFCVKFSSRIDKEKSMDKRRYISLSKNTAGGQNMKKKLLNDGMTRSHRSQARLWE